MTAPIHMQHCWQCQDCGQYGNDGRRCWACASTALWPVGKLLPAAKENAA